jgi:hypothetical protein
MGFARCGTFCPCHPGKYAYGKSSNELRALEEEDSVDVESVLRAAIADRGFMSSSSSISYDLECMQHENNLRTKLIGNCLRVVVFTEYCGAAIGFAFPYLSVCVTIDCNARGTPVLDLLSQTSSCPLAVSNPNLRALLLSLNIMAAKGAAEE